MPTINSLWVPGPGGYINGWINTDDTPAAPVQKDPEYLLIFCEGCGCTYTQKIGSELPCSVHEGRRQKTVKI